MSKAPVVVGAPETVKCVRRVTVDKETGEVISNEGVNEGTVYRLLDKPKDLVLVVYYCSEEVEMEKVPRFKKSVGESVLRRK